MWRNARSLHKRSCGLCGKNLISMYKEESLAPVYCTECFNGADWDPLAYGMEYDFTKPFFLQLKQLFETAPRFYSYKFGNIINSEFTNYVKNAKNAYLSYGIIDVEDVLYSEILDYAKNCMDCLTCDHLEGCYGNIDSDQNYNTHFAVKSRNCIDSYFLYDCSNSSNCALSSNLRNQQYVFKNKKMSKEDYEKALELLNLNTDSGVKEARTEFDRMLKEDTIHKYAFIYSAQNASGDHLHDVKNVKNSFDINDSENISYSNRVLYSKDCFDCSGSGFGEGNYESVAATENTYQDYFCYLTIVGSRDCQYSLILRNCSDCLGCVGLINKQYCIFNKQYTKEEYEKLVPEIIAHMNSMPYVDDKGRVFKYGEFFPYVMCPFGYNESNSGDFFPITRAEALERGYKWLDKEDKGYQITIPAGELPNSIIDVTDQILEEVIGCPNEGNPLYRCTKAFKIVPDELSFYRQKNLPLPHYCPNCRHQERLKYRGQMRLHDRKCNCVLTSHSHSGECLNTFKTPYAPDRPEKVYCESCYNKEVY
jgi:hypothetical protein